MTTADSRYCEHHFEHCPMLNAPKGTAHKVRLCPNHVLDVDYHCFKWCDMESEKACGDCQHWARDHTRLGLGECFFYGSVKKTQQVDCPRYRPREENSLTWVAWVEKTTKSIAGSDAYEADPSSPEVREARKTARTFYRNNFDS